MKLRASSGATVIDSVTSPSAVQFEGRSASSASAPGTAAASGRTFLPAMPTPYIAFQNLARGGAGGGPAGQSSPAGPTRRAGDPAHRSPGGTRPLTTLPGSSSAPAPISAPGISTLSAPTRA